MVEAQMCPTCKQALHAEEAWEEWQDRAWAAAHDRDAARAEAAALKSALERTERNLLLAISQKPVRDLAENLAENRAALCDEGDK